MRPRPKQRKSFLGYTTAVNKLLYEERQKVWRKIFKQDVPDYNMRIPPSDTPDQITMQFESKKNVAILRSACRKMKSTLFCEGCLLFSGFFNVPECVCMCECESVMGFNGFATSVLGISLIPRTGCWL